MEETLRLNKVIAQSGICSRRKADELIAQGRVRVNGAPAEAGMRVSPRDSVTVDGKPLGHAQEHVYLMLNKPVQVVSTASDPQGLDYFSEGLLILTNDGPLAQQLMHPSCSQGKTYEVLVRGNAPEEALNIMRRGMVLAEGDRTAPVKITAGSTPRGNTVLTFTLHQGLNRQIRRMCRDVSLTILRLRRISEGPLRLGNLATGSIRELTPEEVELLRHSPESGFRKS